LDQNLNQKPKKTKLPNSTIKKESINLILSIAIFFKPKAWMQNAKLNPKSTRNSLFAKLNLMSYTSKIETEK
jgi:hypothetical protein